MLKYELIFPSPHLSVIGMLHLPPSPETMGHPGMKKSIQIASTDFKTLIKGGVDAVMIENNYDLPHTENITDKATSYISTILSELLPTTNIPVGLSILWNDYQTALNLSKQHGCQFIRVPVFVDSVSTAYGTFVAKPEKVLSYRNKINANNIALFTDIQVKHATMVTTRPIAESAKYAFEQNSDGLIVTGEWTADSPKIRDLREVKKEIGEGIPILIGSGATKENISNLSKYVNAVIVGTTLKEGTELTAKQETNIKPWQNRISLEKTKQFVKAAKQYR